MRVENIEVYKIYSEAGFTKKDILNENKALAFTLNIWLCFKSVLKMDIY